MWRDLAISILQLVGQPVKSLIQAITTGGTRRLYVPVAVSQRMQAQFICYFCSIHCIWQILPTHNKIISNTINMKSGITHATSFRRSCLSPVLKQVHHHSKNIWEQSYHHEQLFPQFQNFKFKLHYIHILEIPLHINSMPLWHSYVIQLVQSCHHKVTKDGTNT